jgi:hypothetical protein
MLAHIVDSGVFSLVSGILEDKKTNRGIKTHFYHLSYVFVLGHIVIRGAYIWVADIYVLKSTA